MTKSIPNAVPDTSSLALGTFSVIVDTLEKAAGKSVNYCSECNTRVSWDASNRPRVCRKCGQEFDWDYVVKKEVKACPQCKKQYEFEDVYCSEHFPAVRLETISVN